MVHSNSIKLCLLITTTSNFSFLALVHSFDFVPCILVPFIWSIDISSHKLSSLWVYMGQSKWSLKYKQISVIFILRFYPYLVDFTSWCGVQLFALQIGQGISYAVTVVKAIFTPSIISMTGKLYLQTQLDKINLLSDNNLIYHIPESFSMSGEDICKKNWTSSDDFIRVVAE